MENIDPLQAKVEVDSLDKGEAVPRKNAKIILFTLVGLFILGGAAEVLFLHQNNKTSNEIKPTQISVVPLSAVPSPINAQKVGLVNTFETKDTKKASSLGVPPLYTQVQWEEIKQDATVSDLNKVFFAEDLSQVAFKNGKYWKSTTPAAFFAVENYYNDDLKKKGWIVLGTNETIAFRSFGLQNLIADGVCGGFQTALGYKDGLIRMIGIERTIKPCNTPETPLPSGVQSSMYYTIFISDPTPIEDFAPH
jgi:hypothetical protein